MCVCVYVCVCVCVSVSETLLVWTDAKAKQPFIQTRHSTEFKVVKSNQQFSNCQSRTTSHVCLLLLLLLPPPPLRRGNYQRKKMSLTSSSVVFSLFLSLSLSFFDFLWIFESTLFIMKRGDWVLSLLLLLLLFLPHLVIKRKQESRLNSEVEPKDYLSLKVHYETAKLRLDGGSAFNICRQGGNYEPVSESSSRFSSKRWKERAWFNWFPV